MDEHTSIGFYEELESAILSDMLMMEELEPIPEEDEE